MQAMLETYCRTERKAEGEIYRKRTCRGIQNEEQNDTKRKVEKGHRADWKRELKRRNRS